MKRADLLAWDDEPPHDAAKQAAALALIKEASELALTGEYDDAAGRYSKAIRLWWDSERAVPPEFSFPLALCFDRAGHPLDALEYLHVYLGEADKDAKRVAVARSAVQRLDRIVGHVRINLLDHELGNGGIRIDGQLASLHPESVVGGAIYVVDVAPGFHELAAQPSGFQAAEHLEPSSSVTVQAGETVTAVFHGRKVRLPVQRASPSDAGPPTARGPQ